MAQKEIIEAIQSVRSQVGSLVKSAENKHGGYNFVPIDTYYEKVASLATKAGLIWRSQEKSFELVNIQTKSGDKTHAKATYSYSLYLKEHEFPDFMTVTIINQVVGAQTTGQLFSYADKVFMRVAFCVRTGEEDADASEPDPVLSVPTPTVRRPEVTQPTPPHDPATGEIKDDLVSGETDGLPTLDTRKINENAVKTIEKIFETWLPTIGTRAKLTDFHASNFAAIEKVKTIDPAAHDRIKALFNAKFKELKEKGK